MRYRVPVLIAGVALCIAAAGCSSTGPDVPDGASAEEIFAAAESTAAAGNQMAAIDLYDRILDEYPSSQEARMSEWQAAEAAFAMEDFEEALVRYKQYHAVHPMDRLGPIENRSYEIGERLYGDGQGGLLGLGIFSTSEKGIETMRWITENLRNGSRADDAYIYMGERRLEERSYQEAVIYFEEILNHYQESEWYLKALLLKAQAHLNLNRGARYDMGALKLARKELNRYVRAMERDPVRKNEYAGQIAEARANLKLIDDRMAERKLQIARFYIEQERQGAADIYLNDAIADYPGTEAAEKAKTLLDRSPE